MSLLRYPQTLPNTGGIQWLLRAERPTRAGPTVAPLPLGISVDTGTLERVANWSPDSVATVDPCDPGTDPRNGPFAGIPLRQYLFNIVLHGNVLEAVVVRRNLLYSRAEVSWFPRPTACRRAVGMLTVARFCVCSIGLSFVLALALCFVLFTCVFTALELVHVNFICIVQGSLSLSILCSRLPQSHFGVSPEEYR